MIYSDKECQDCQSTNFGKLEEKRYDEDTFNCNDCNRTWSGYVKYCKACLDVVIYCSCA